MHEFRQLTQWLGRPAQLAIAPHGAALSVPAGWLRVRHAPPARIAFDEGALVEPALLADAIAGLVEGSAIRGRALKVVVADRLARVFVVQPPANAERVPDIDAAAHAHFARLFGTSAGWALSVDAHAGPTCMASALPTAIVGALASLPQRCGVSPVSVLPHTVAAFNRWRRQLKAGDWFGVFERRHLSLAALGADGVIAARTMLLAPEVLADADGMAKFIAQETLRMAVAPPARLQLCGDVPRAWAGRSDRRSGCVHLGRDMAARGGAPEACVLLAAAGGVQ